MNKLKFMRWVAGGVTLLASGTLHAVVSGDLLTNNALTTGWQNCEGSNLVGDTAGTFDANHLEGEGCVYRETPADEGQQYKMTCGVSSFKYSSLTLAFLNDEGTTLATETEEIFEDTAGGAYSVTLTAPAGTTTAAVGIYGLEGSGFQDCTLLLDNPAPTPVDGSISGLAWFDENGDSMQQGSETTIGSTPVSIYLGDVLVSSRKTKKNGGFYFGGLDVGACYRIEFGIPDPTLTYGSAGGENDIVNEGSTAEICLTDAEPNVTFVRGGFVAVPPPAPPEDYAVCGAAFLNDTDTVELLPNIKVALYRIGSRHRKITRTNASGTYSFDSVAEGNYKLVFKAPAAFSFVEGGTDFTGGSIVDSDGVSFHFNVPGDDNTPADDACTINNANVSFVRTPVALDPTTAHDDMVEGLIGSALSVLILANDELCGGSALEVDILGHNVPGNVTYDAATGSLNITDTTEAGTFSIEYGVRGDCGSYGKASVIVTIEPLPVEPPAGGPDAPQICHASIGKLTGTEKGVHVDVNLPEGESFDDYFTPEYNFYNKNKELLFTGFRDAGDPLSAKVNVYGLHWKNGIHGIDVQRIRYVTAVEGGLESPFTRCIRRPVTPIALDTDKSGQVERISGLFDFDLNGDGIDEQLTEWFDPNDGILIYRDFGDKISGAHLMGDTGGKFSDGFQKLALEDLNSDGKLSGNELSKLAIWTDRNSNQSVDEGEISSIASHSIDSLSVEHYKYAARATLENGRTLLMRDLWFPMSSIEQASK